LILAPDFTDLVELIRKKNIFGGLISNQAAIGKKILTLQKLEEINMALAPLASSFLKWVEEICPHTQLENCNCRKPNPGLINNALTKLGVDRSEVVLIGDSHSDFQAAEQARIRYVHTCWDSKLCPRDKLCGHSLLNATRLALNV
jgi:histidinol-phosphate phosphatase family protein